MLKRHWCWESSDVGTIVTNTALIHCYCSYIGMDTYTLYACNIRSMMSMIVKFDRDQTGISKAVFKDMRLPLGPGTDSHE